MIDRLQWLKLEYNPSIELCPKTNQQILDMVAEERPDGWFDPFNSQELEKARKEFKGSSLKWQQYVEEKLPMLNPLEERKLKLKLDRQKKLENCGELVNRMNSQGIYKLVPQWCNNYKECPKCKARRQQEHFDRLMKLDGQPFVINRRAEMAATYGKEHVYSFKLASGDEVTVIVTNEKVENASGEISHEIARQEITVSGTKVSGDAGKEKRSQLEVDESTPVLLTSCTFEASEELRQQIEKEYLEETKDFSPSSIPNLASLLLKCQQIFFAIIQRYCEEIHIVGKYFVYINENDLDWTNRQLYIEKRLLLLKNQQRK